MCPCPAARSDSATLAAPTRTLCSRSRSIPGSTRWWSPGSTPPATTAHRQRHTVNATLSVVLADLPEQRRGPLPTDDPSAKPSEMDVVGVDGGVVAAIDWSAYALLCEQGEEQLESLFLDDMASRPTPGTPCCPAAPRTS